MTMTEPHRTLVEALTARWPEHRIAPSLGRVQALMELLGEPQHSCPVIQVAGTNGKGSTAIIIDALLRSLGLRTGRYSSPHLVDVVERICIDGEPIAHQRFDEIWGQIEPFVTLVDERRIDGVPMTFFEVVTALAYAAFADAPVDVMIMETGLGGTWDATNVATAQVAVICPIDFDHMHILGDTIEQIAAEKAGIIKPGATAVIAGQRPEAARVLLERCAEVGATAVVEGPGFSLIDRRLAVGGQLVRIETSGGPVGDLELPLFGAHMAHNAALAVAAVEAFLGGRALDPKVIADGFAQVVAPGRTEVVHHSPTIVLDTGHNPHGARATVDAVTESFALHPLIGLVSMMADKDVEGALRIFSEAMSQVVVTTASSTDRALPVEELAEVAEGIFGGGNVTPAPTMADAIEEAIRLADEAGPTAGVLIAGSVIGAGEARAILLSRAEDEAAPEPASGTGDDQW